MPDLPLSHYVDIYRQAMQQGDIQKAYAGIIKALYKTRTEFISRLAGQYSVGNILHGYLDVTYFYMKSDLLKDKKLKLGIMLNHQDVSFELWFFGATVGVQEAYWTRLIEAGFVVGEMPAYALMEIKLDAQPDFDDLDKLVDKLEASFKANLHDLAPLIAYL